MRDGMIWYEEDRSGCREVPSQGVGEVFCRQDWGISLGPERRHHLLQDK